MDGGGFQVEGGECVGAVLGVLLGGLVQLVVVMIVGKAEANSAAEFWDKRCVRQEGGCDKPVDGLIGVFLIHNQITCCARDISLGPTIMRVSSCFVASSISR